jgi:hypothetical protein
MIIILKNISENTTLRMIANFIEPYIIGGKIINTSLIAQQDSERNIVEYHALVTIVPDSIAEQAISKLHLKTINGKFVSVTEYQYRFRNNDPRLKQITPPSDKRRGDRRRKLFNIAPKVVETSLVRIRRYSRI